MKALAGNFPARAFSFHISDANFTLSMQTEYFKMIIHHLDGKAFHPRNIYFTLLVLALSFSMFSCYEEKFTTDQNDSLSFSTDTLSFDTVLTSISTVTRYFK